MTTNFKRMTVAFSMIGLLAGPVSAADLGAGMCRLAGPSQLMTIQSDVQLTDEVVRLMTEAVNVADDERWIASRSPAFTWAFEAKVACGKAYGYLRNNYRDEQYLDKCECFHQRMVGYMY
ncbi:hypothetical protein E2A64_16050 [Pseudohoeflea suaedae]|uniref:Uncharacterized protein n=1 Tax=Pseudohoeflea suaedae TaxID=877384 RepID=A0A4R5PJ54_9HYPH|nr:hypothetical protein [Pseudohoeflea suaedae]TDH35212.1 hypothetical protein E2A64_16050 [Pseudohoeflea suaedae]